MKVHEMIEALRSLDPDLEVGEWEDARAERRRQREAAEREKRLEDEQWRQNRIEARRDEIDYLENCGREED